MGFFTRLYETLFGDKQDELVAAPAALPSNVVPEGKKRPVIGISGSSGQSKSVVAMMTQIRSAGAEPVFIGEHATRIAGGVEQAVTRDLARIDGLVVLGNDDDIDPAKYGQKPHKDTHIEAPERAAYEELAMQRALDMGMPLVAVCAGMQRLNVLGGGTLNQSVAEKVGSTKHHQGDIAPFIPVQLVSIDPSSKLQTIAGSTTGVYTPTRGALPDNIIMENSFHHQAVDKVRDDFRVSAISSEDGVAEAIEPKTGSKYDGQFVVGVQWHPEFGASDFGAKLATQVTLASSEFSKDKEMGQSPAMMGQMPIEGEIARKMLERRQNQMLLR